MICFLRYETRIFIWIMITKVAFVSSNTYLFFQDLNTKTVGPYHHATTFRPSQAPIMKNVNDARVCYSINIEFQC